MRCFREDWTKEDAEKSLAARVLGVAPASTSTEAVGPTVGQVIARLLETRGKSKRNKSVVDDLERSRPVVAFFGRDTQAAAITTARVADYGSIDMA